MSGSRHPALYGHLMHCMDCRISDMRFCPEAKQMGEGYREHLGEFQPGGKREQMHDDFVNAVIRGRVNRWQTAERDKFFAMWRAA